MLIHVLRFALPLLLTIAAFGPPVILASDDRPNFLVIMTDDLGYSDLGCYGSEIATPTLDSLAARGLRFSQFYNTAKCHSSRVSLLSGRWCYQAGNVSLSRAVTVAETLSSGGYFTAMTGKWHLKKEPTNFGFDRYFGHLSGACDYYRGDNTFRLNGQPWQVPAQDFYTTVADVDYALRFLDDAREAKKPWLLYVAFNAPHAPLQPLKEDYERYLGKYDAGWDVIRRNRAARQKELRLFGSDVIPSERPESVASWDSLSDESRTKESRRMAAYAALIDRIDRETGRLVTNLREAGELDNTLILFISDNGACPYDRRGIGIDEEPYAPGIRWSDSTPWAWARNTPFRYYKQNQFEGGVATPAIVHWPAGLKTPPGSIVRTPAHLVDVLPTLADLADVPVPPQWPNREPTPLAGVSLAPIFAGRELPERPPIHFQFGTDRGLRDGDWKLVSFRSQPWELYNLATDRTERANVAEQHPEIVGRMVERWHQMARDVLMAPDKVTQPVAEQATGHVHPDWTVFGPSAEEGKLDTSPRSARSPKARVPGSGGTKEIRARKGTKMTVEGSQLVLQCEGEDPGLALNKPPVEAAGPYTLEFRVLSNASGGAEIYWTTDSKTTLPNGGHLEFPVTHDSQWHDIALTIPEEGRLFLLRLDVCSAAGEARIDGLQLKGASGKVLKRWP